MPVQPQLVLLQKTLLNVEGLGRQLYPDLDLWQTAKPFLEKWIKTQVGPRAFFRKVKQQLPFWLEKLPELPGLIYNALEASPNSAKCWASQAQPNPRANKPKYRRFFLLGVTFGLLFAGIFLSIFTTKIHSVTIQIFLGLAMVGLVGSL